ncbi:MAG TPA: hypothetical protein VG759_18305 [Candidatus Angelobacter sp.]|nr:hypothetical protein [Candidatus Angelobacter sp.]
MALVPVEGGVYQVNHIVDEESGPPAPDRPLQLPSSTLRASHSHRDHTLVATSVGLYDPKPQEIALHPVEAVVKIPKRVPKLFSNNHDQLQAQFRVTSDFISETAGNLIFNHSDFGLLHNVAPRMQFAVDGPPTPDVLDDMLKLAWRRPDLFVMHPDALAEFRKQANAQSLNLEEVEAFGSPFTAWRSLPLVPSNKLHIISKAGKKGEQAGNKKAESKPSPKGGSTSILLMRLGEAKQGVIYLSPRDAEAPVRLPSISVEFMGLTDDAVAHYLLTTYTGVAVLSSGALARADVQL